MNVDSRCITTQIRQAGCSVTLDGTPISRLILDLDAPSSPLPPPNQRCDYLFFADAADGDGWLAPVELKRGRFDASEAVGQIRAGTQAAHRIVPRNLPVRFRPVAAFGGGTTKEERRRSQLRQNWVTFRGSAQPLRLMKCGGKLAERLK